MAFERNREIVVNALYECMNGYLKDGFVVFDRSHMGMVSDVVESELKVGGITVLTLSEIRNSYDGKIVNKVEWSSRITLEQKGKIALEIERAEKVMKADRDAAEKTRDEKIQRKVDEYL